MSLTIYFNGQYWCGVVEYLDGNGNLIVKEYIFGPEPKVDDINQFILKVLPKILNEPWFADTKHVKERFVPRKINPKRLQRIINKDKKQKGMSSKSQEAIRLQHEEKKKISQKLKKERRELYLKDQFEKKQRKKREKHRGH